MSSSPTALPPRPALAAVSALAAAWKRPGWLRRPRAADHLGLIHSPQRLSAAVVRTEIDGSARLLACANFAGTLDLGRVSAWLRQRRLRPATATLLLPGDDYQIHAFEAPGVPAAERAEATRWRIKDLIDFPAEEACVDCVVLPAGDGHGLGHQAMAVVARRQRVHEWMRRARAAHLDLQAVDIPELALRNLLALRPTPQACALLRIGATRGSLIVVWRGELCTFRRFELSGLQFSSSDLQTRQMLFERLGLEVQRTADAFERQFHATAIERVWVEQSVPGMDLVQQLAPQVTLRVEPFELGDWLNVQGLDSRDADGLPPNLIAVGGALRPVLQARDAASATPGAAV